MSVYNETLKELSRSINSVLNQTYNNVELIIVNDNPHNKIVSNFLEKKAKEFNNIILKKNVNNLGLVSSLNKAIFYSSGEFIARMDADDYSYPDRFMRQLNYLKVNNFDLIGGNINLVEENGGEIGTLQFPRNNKSVRQNIKWGNCLPHPTWFGKASLFKRLEYRNVPYCEDYDFLLRALKEHYILGNVPTVVLNYTIRKNSISKSNENKQILIRRYLATSSNIRTIASINEYIESDGFQKEVEKYQYFLVLKKQLKLFKKNKEYFRSIPILLKMFFDKNLYWNFFEKESIKRRGRYKL